MSLHPRNLQFSTSTSTCRSNAVLKPAVCVHAPILPAERYLLSLEIFLQNFHMAILLWYSEHAVVLLAVCWHGLTKMLQSAVMYLILIQVMHTIASTHWRGLCSDDLWQTAQSCIYRSKSHECHPSCYRWIQGEILCELCTTNQWTRLCPILQRWRVRTVLYTMPCTHVTLHPASWLFNIACMHKNVGKRLSRL